MLRSRIIPCLLLHDGGLIKTRRFADPKYIGDPLNAVKIFNEKEVDELIFFDIDATVKRSAPDKRLLRSLAVESRMPLCYGGGIMDAAIAAEIVSLGFEKVSVSAAAIARPALLREMCDAIGRQSVVLTLDARRNKLFGGYSLRTHNASVTCKVGLLEMCGIAVDQGVGEIIVNAVDRDGMANGYDLELARAVRNSVSVPISFVGGAGDVRHMQELIDAVGIVGAAAGSMFVFKGPYRAVLISYSKPERLGVMK